MEKKYIKQKNVYKYWMFVNLSLENFHIYFQIILLSYSVSLSLFLSYSFCTFFDFIKSSLSYLMDKLT